MSDIADNPSENDVTPMETDHPPNEIEEGNRTELKLKRANALYILRTKEVNLLTQKCVDDIVLGTGELIRSTVETVGNGVRECLNSAGIPCETVPGLQELFAANNPVSNPFEHVSTKYKQMSFFKQEFGLIVSIYFNCVLFQSALFYAIYSIFILYYNLLVIGLQGSMPES